MAQEIAGLKWLRNDAFQPYGTPRAGGELAAGMFSHPKQSADNLHQQIEPQARFKKKTHPITGRFIKRLRAESFCALCGKKITAEMAGGEDP